ncbi:MAG: methionyl-tRNA formyltransferase [Gammaproteobacteria bacterium]|nr:methionyl-tRNA formyltransferase [Gammaproteobacteria bacterium]
MTPSPVGTPSPAGTLRVAFAGTPDFALSAFHALVGSRHTVVGVLTQPDRPKGRGRQLAASPVKLAALERGIPVSQPVTLKTEVDRADLAAWQPDVLVVVAYGLILPRAALDLPRLGCVNIHASLLPRWRGAAPIQRAILAGDAQTGVSIMRMDVGLDTGPVFLERTVAISPTETGGSLHDRLAAEGASAVVEVLDELAADRARSTPQREDGVTYAAKIDKSEAQIDWSRSAVEIERQVRAFNPWPIAETRLDGEQLRIYAANAIGGDNEPNVGENGQIVDVLREGAIIVACGRGRLALTELQRPGRRPVAARDLINTLDLAGRRLG